MDTAKWHLRIPGPDGKGFSYACGYHGVDLSTWDVQRVTCPECKSKITEVK